MKYENRNPAKVQLQTVKGNFDFREERFRKIFEEGPLGMAIFDLDHRFLRANIRLYQMLGYPEPELTRLTFSDLAYEQDFDRDRRLIQRVLQGEIPYCKFERRYLKKNGELLWVNLTISVIHNEVGQPDYGLAMVEDINERKQLEAQFLQAQKMETIGQLAGGIAHDFNNLLAVIKGYSELLLYHYPDKNDRHYQDVQRIKEASEQAAKLTRWLLAFGRQQAIQPRAINLSYRVTALEMMLQSLIGPKIELVVYLDPALGEITADRAQIEQIIMNLAINARDAMPEGGRLTIETANVEFGPTSAMHNIGLKPGPYAMLAVSDTGLGMDADTQAHIFDPFFTTKPPDKGTGLGLSTVYSVVQQNGGYISVSSRPEQGTTFKIYFPQFSSDPNQTVQTGRSVQSYTQFSPHLDTILLENGQAKALNPIRVSAK